MKRFSTTVFLFSIVLFSACKNEPKNSLVGTWRLASWQTISDNDSVLFPYGDDALGTLIYTDNGEVSLTLAFNKRDTLPTDDRSKIDAESAKVAYNSYFAYTGNYQLDTIAKIVKHSIEISLLPNWQGTTQSRNYQLFSDSLVLSANRVGGKYHLLQWKRK